MDPPIYYSKAEFIETVCRREFSQSQWAQTFVGYREQSITSSDDRWPAEHHSRWKDHHLERSDYSWRPATYRSRTRCRHFFGTVLPRRRGMRHEVSSFFFSLCGPFATLMLYPDHHIKHTAEISTIILWRSETMSTSEPTRLSSSHNRKSRRDRQELCHRALLICIPCFQVK